MYIAIVKMFNQTGHTLFSRKSTASVVTHHIPVTTLVSTSAVTGVSVPFPVTHHSARWSRWSGLPGTPVMRYGLWQPSEFTAWSLTTFRVHRVIFDNLQSSPRDLWQPARFTTWGPESGPGRPTWERSRGNGRIYQIRKYTTIQSILTRFGMLAFL